MDDAEEWRDPDSRMRSRKSDVQGKFYHFLNRSAQSLTRSNSQSGRTRRVKDKDREQLQASSTTANDRDRDPPRASHAALSSRLPQLTSGHALETSRTGYDSSARTSRSAAVTATAAAAIRDAAQPRKSSPPPPLKPLLQHKFTVSSSPNSKTPSIAYSYNTPPQTPSRSRKYSTPSSPSSIAAGGRGVVVTDLLLNRPLARPITPSNSGTSRKVLGIPIPSPNPRKAKLEAEASPKRQTHGLRSGSGSSNEPLLHNRTPTNGSERVPPRPSTSTVASTPRTNLTPDDQTPLPTPSSSLPRSHRSAVSREEPPASPTTSSRRGTPKLDFWRSMTPRAPSAQGDREKGKQSIATPDRMPHKEGQQEQRPALVSPQPRVPAAFLPSIPQFQRLPPTPQRREQRDAPGTVRLDSFMSDSLPVPQTLLKVPQGGEPSGLTRQPAFTQVELPRTPRTPVPEHKPAPALGIQRSKSAPGTRGRLSPCLRIPSPKFLTRERSKDRDKEKDKDKGMLREKRRVTPESVGAPMLREPRAHMHVHTQGHTHVHAHTQGHALGHVGETGLKASKTSMVQLRRAAHGTFDFERPGSRTSSKSGQSESYGTRSDDDREKDKENEVDGRRVLVGKPVRSPEPIRTKLKSPSSPVPPLPTPRLKPHSPPPPRTRSPLAAAPSTMAHSHVHIDDSALPRLSSSLARRNSSSAQHHRTHARVPASLPHFSFEPAAPAPPSALKPLRNAGGQYIDTHTGLIMFAPTIPEDPTRQGGRRRTMSNAHVAFAPIPPKELDEATAVITQFKGALDDAGFATLQKYVRRYDAQIIPLDGPAGLLARVQRLLETSAPRVDERRKRQLYESFARVITQVS